MTNPGDRTHDADIREDIINADSANERNVVASCRVARIFDAHIREDVINADPAEERNEVADRAVAASRILLESVETSQQAGHDPDDARLGSVGDEALESWDRACGPWAIEQAELRQAVVERAAAADRGAARNHVIARNHVVADVAESGDGITNPGGRTHEDHIREGVIDADSANERNVVTSCRVARIFDAHIREDVINADTAEERNIRADRAVRASGVTGGGRTVFRCGCSGGAIGGLRRGCAARQGRIGR